MIQQAAVLGIGLVFTVVCRLAEGRKKESNGIDRELVIGGWELVSTEEHMADRSKRPYQDVGPKGKGYLMYTADGHMCAAGINPDCPAWGDVNKPTDQEKLRAMEGFFGYCGRYKIDTANHVIYHLPRGSLGPELRGN